MTYRISKFAFKNRLYYMPADATLVLAVIYLTQFRYRKFKRGTAYDRGSIQHLQKR